MIRSAIRFVERALKPFCEIADGRIPACWRCENVQVIWHRNRRQNSPLIEPVEHSTAYLPRLSISKHTFARLDAKGNEINRALFPRQPVWNARRSAHDYRLIISPSHRDGLQINSQPHLVPADLPALVLFFQPAHQWLEVIHHRASGDVFAGSFFQNFAPIFGAAFF